MAIAALSMDGAGSVRGPALTSPKGRRARALGVAMIRFALGHALLLAVGAGPIVLIGWSIPPPVERGGEMLGGALLIVRRGLGHAAAPFAAPPLRGNKRARAPASAHSHASDAGGGRVRRQQPARAGDAHALRRLAGHGAAALLVGLIGICRREPVDKPPWRATRRATSTGESRRRSRGWRTSSRMHRRAGTRSFCFTT